MREDLKVTIAFDVLMELLDSDYGKNNVENIGCIAGNIVNDLFNTLFPNQGSDNDIDADKKCDKKEVDEDEVIDAMQMVVDTLETRLASLKESLEETKKNKKK